jgi:hypothetical protein
MGSVAVRPSASAEARGGEAGGAGAGDGYKGSHYEGGERGREGGMGSVPSRAGPGGRRTRGHGRAGGRWSPTPKAAGGRAPSLRGAGTGDGGDKVADRHRGQRGRSQLQRALLPAGARVASQARGTFIAGSGTGYQPGEPGAGDHESPAPYDGAGGQGAQGASGAGRYWGAGDRGLKEGGGGQRRA